MKLADIAKNLRKIPTILLKFAFSIAGINTQQSQKRFFWNFPNCKAKNLQNRHSSQFQEHSQRKN